MGYRLMRLGKYYDAFRTNKPFFKTSMNQEIKILLNIFRFFKSNFKKSLIIKNKPVTAQIEPTSKCNLKCEFCVREKIGVPIGSMSFANFKKILDKLDCLFKIHLSGQGEPFLNSELFKMIKYANQKGALVNLTTNGTLLTENMIDKICQVEIGEISISLESTKKKIYEKLRKRADFDKVIKNIKNLNEKLEEKRKRTITSFAVIILKENINEIEEFIKLANKTGIKKIIFQTVQEKEDYVEKYTKKIKSQMVSDFIEKVKKKIKKAEKIAEKDNIDIIFDEQKSIGCLWPWRSIYITWNGYVTVCCKILNYNEPLMGNILEQDFWKIWNNKQYQMFRRLLRERKTPLACKGCSMV